MNSFETNRADQFYGELTPSETALLLLSNQAPNEISAYILTLFNSLPEHEAQRVRRLIKSPDQRPPSLVLRSDEEVSNAEKVRNDSQPELPSEESAIGKLCRILLADKTGKIITYLALYYLIYPDAEISNNQKIAKTRLMNANAIRIFQRLADEAIQNGSETVRVLQVIRGSGLLITEVTSQEYLQSRAFRTNPAATN
ncbi:hypothetical protein KA082_01065 [Candidatus Woesebacteria bacterium]|nr:hypothetical protein [Candidatus Woesebacteria bacterium]